MQAIQPMQITGVYLFEKQFFLDDRGYFGVGYTKKELQEIGINNDMIQYNFSYSKKNALRGLHYQKEPYQQEKLVMVIKGAIIDVIVDFRKESPTYLKHIKIELNEEKNQFIFIPKGCLHGFLALEDSIVCYHCSDYYNPKHEVGIAWNDPTLGIKWPTTKPILSTKDSNNLMITNL